MKDHIEPCHLTEFDAFRISKDQVMNLETWFQSHTNLSNVETCMQHPQEPYKLSKCFISFVTTVKSYHSPTT